eukprot:scaffold22458_cov124-Isochrysis_galbana.AAC.3
MQERGARRSWRQGRRSAEAATCTPPASSVPIGVRLRLGVRRPEDSVGRDSRIAVRYILHVLTKRLSRATAQGAKTARDRDTQCKGPVV